MENAGYHPSINFDINELTVESFEKTRKSAEKKYSEHYNGNPPVMAWYFGEEMYDKLKELGCLPKNSFREKAPPEEK